ncbi:MAG: thiamine ABC transporter substrate-binding protein [Desulforhopalus sp.]
MKGLSTLGMGLVLILLGVLCAASAHAEKTITLMTHDSFNVSKEIIAKFEKENGVKVRFLKAGDAGAALIQAILSKENPLADVFFGVDNSFLSRARKADIFLSYHSPLLSDIPSALQLDKQYKLLPVDYGDVCLNYDKQWFTANGLAPPNDLSDLTKPEYKGLTVVENPATSSPGMAFLLATIGRFGEKGYLEFWKKLRENNVIVAGGWEDAYFGHFTAASQGDRPIVVSYASSPPAAVYYSEKKLQEAPTGAVVSDNTCFRQIEFVGILKGTKSPQLAEKLVDFMLDTEFQEDIPLQMFVFPANSHATLPDIFVKHAGVADKTVDVSPAAIEANRDKWIEAWTDVVIR